MGNVLNKNLSVCVCVHVCVVIANTRKVIRILLLAVCFYPEIFMFSFGHIFNHNIFCSISLFVLWFYACKSALRSTECH